MSVIKCGARIQTISRGGGPSETGTICRWLRHISGERMPGWHVVRFDCDGARVCMHESNFKVVQ